MTMANTIRDLLKTGQADAPAILALERKPLSFAALRALG